MGNTERVLVLYPSEGERDGADGALVGALRQAGGAVEEMVIGDAYEAVLDRLAVNVLPVVVK